MPSGFVKQAVVGSVVIELLGLNGDEQADLRVHGGPDKAVYCYPVEHYARRRAMAPSYAPLLLVPGGFGENLTTEGFDEGCVSIGDIFRIGQATVQLTQPRQPCFKLALRFLDPQIVRTMVRSGLSGWYFRVLEPGPVQAGALMTLIDHPNPAWSITRCNRLIGGSGGTLSEMAELADPPGLALGWQKNARAALDAVSTAKRRGA